MQDGLELDLSKTYIYEGNEYILTGRVAERSPDAPPPRRSRRRRNAEIPDITPELDLMVEIKPSPRNSGGSMIGVPTESRWVKMSELYAVLNILEDDEGEE